MAGRFARSLDLVKASYAVLRQDKELLLFPLFSGIATLLVAASFLIPLFLTHGIEEVDRLSDNPGAMVVLFLFYLSQYFVMFFFNAALVGAALIRLEGGNPTVSDGLRVAREHLVQIIGYAAIAATVGLILRLIEERAGFIGRWIAGLLGIAFTVATFLTVPILVTSNVGPVEAVKESAGLLKKTWGENIIGNGGMGLVFGIIYLAVITLGLLCVFLVSATGNAVLIVAMVALTVLAAITVGLVHAALQGVYSAALYRYAAEGEAGAEFSGTLLSSAFKPKS